MSRHGAGSRLHIMFCRRAYAALRCRRSGCSCITRRVLRFWWGPHARNDHLPADYIKPFPFKVESFISLTACCAVDGVWQHSFIFFVPEVPPHRNLLAVSLPQTFSYTQNKVNNAYLRYSVYLLPSLLCGLSSCIDYC